MSPRIIVSHASFNKLIAMLRYQLTVDNSYIFHLTVYAEVKVPSQRKSPTRKLADHLQGQCQSDRRWQQ